MLKFTQSVENAIELNNLELIKELLAIQPLPISNAMLTKADKHRSPDILFFLLSQGANPIVHPIDTTIFRLKPLDKLLSECCVSQDLHLFAKVWDLIDKKHKTRANKELLKVYYLQNTVPLNVEFINMINFGKDIEARKNAQNNNRSTLINLYQTLASRDLIHKIRLENTAGHLKNLAQFTSKQAAFLRIHAQAYSYFSCNIVSCLNDLKILNQTLLDEWKKQHPESSFPELQHERDYTLDYRYDLFVTRPALPVSVKFNRILRKILIRDLRAFGLFPVKENNDNMASYFKFIGYIPKDTADRTLSHSLCLFSEGYTTPSAHTHYAHMIQWWLLAKAFARKDISLTSGNERFTFKEFFLETLNPIYSNCYEGYGLWDTLLDQVRLNSTGDNLLLIEPDHLRICIPSDLMSIIRQHHQDPALKALAHYIIGTDLNRINKLRMLGLSDNRLDALANPRFEASHKELLNEVKARFSQVKSSETIRGINLDTKPYLVIKKTIRLD